MVFDPEAMKGIQAAAKQLAVEWQALAAVAEVESDGRPLWEGLCPIRIEGHYFDRLLSGEAQQRARKAGLANAKVGAVKNSNSMVERYRMLDKMIAIDEAAALQSCSWGLGQVMGANWKSLGYASVSELVDEAKSSVAGQVRVMTRFIEANKRLPAALKKRDWTTFASIYNGPSYKKYNYDTRMAAAYGWFISGAGSDAGALVGAVKTIVERGDKGAAVEMIQERLAELNYYNGRIDGDFGGGTEAAVMDFQRAAGIQVDGRVGPITRARLEATGKSAPPPGTGKIVPSQVVYTNQHAIRNRPVTANLETTLAAAIAAVFGSGTRAEIYSGGQPRLGTPGARTGTIRHDDYGAGGRALDAHIFTSTGKQIVGLELARLGQYWLAKRHGGCGLEMAGGGIHLDEWTSPPTKNAGMQWTYAYSDKLPYGPALKKMLVDGEKGILPKLASS